jgi:PKD repeat protein
MRITAQLPLAALLLTATGCTLSETKAPAMTGPSELALRVALRLVPDSILQDGASQAALSIEAAGVDGRPVRGLPLRVATLFDGVIQDFGTLSAKTVVTGEDGRARVVYTAPPRPAEPVEQGNIVGLLVEPIGNDYTGEIQRSVTLRLVTPGVLLPPNAAPEPEFTYSPSAPLPLADVVFDASLTTDEGLPCGSVCGYRWDFGDGESATGIFVKHQYLKGGTYQVRLTVTDVRGASSVLARTIQVGEAIAPSVSFVLSPTAPKVGQTIFFNAEASRPAAGRRIVSYDWDFGSGRTGSGITTTKSYDTPASYSVTLTVTDDAGAKATVSQTVTVSNDLLMASGGSGRSGRASGAGNTRHDPPDSADPPDLPVLPDLTRPTRPTRPGRIYAVAVAESERIAELRRRVDADPASSAFGQLAEEYRRAGAYHDAVNCCRIGLARHPGYLAARITLARSLLAIDRPDEAAAELEFVLRVAPDHLSALRAMAEMHQRRGVLGAALAYYKRALAVARFDADLEATINGIERQLAAAKSTPMTDFDSLLRSMGMPEAAPPPSLDRLIRGEHFAPVLLPGVPGSANDDDPFGWLEGALRAVDQTDHTSSADAVVDELEAWLWAVAAARARSRGR